MYSETHYSHKLNPGHSFHTHGNVMSTHASGSFSKNIVLSPFSTNHACSILVSKRLRFVGHVYPITLSRVLTPEEAQKKQRKYLKMAGKAEKMLSDHKKAGIYV